VSILRRKKLGGKIKALIPLPEGSGRGFCFCFLIADPVAEKKKNIELVLIPEKGNVLIPLPKGSGRIY
jgi:hypothetical protein